MRNNRMSQTAALAMLTVICVCWNFGAASEGAVDCCLITVTQKIPQGLVKTYYTQTLEMGCRLPATVFVTKKNKRLCAPPATKNNWVQKLINHLKEKPRRKPKGRKQKTAFSS